ncbi:MAG TPA: ABC transporter permease, partial [Candidatus Methylacidiphilales bacterium]|nr:ABC transporter permease [Candidatus Methylacidiphilales bacterium]
IGSLLLAYIISIPIGVSSAVGRDSFFDRITTFGLFLLYSLPSFWIATLALVFLCGGDYWNIFPASNLSSMGAENLPLGSWILDRLWHLVLPLSVLTYPSLAALSRYARTGMLEIIRQDYMRTARAKGLPERTVIFVHGLRNSLIPIITLLAFELPAILGGSVIVEQIFGIQGMGVMTLQAIQGRDYTLIMGIFTISAFLTLAGFLIGDILYCVADPRIRLN